MRRYLLHNAFLLLVPHVRPRKDIYFVHDDAEEVIKTTRIIGGDKVNKSIDTTVNLTIRYLTK
jgi:hypothetical protein